MICSEGLNGLIQQVVVVGELKVFFLVQEWPTNIPLFFFLANDSSIFCRAKMGDVQAIQTILSKYEKALGQQVNSLKTNLFFVKLVYDNTKNDLKNFLCVPKIKEYEKYLRLPTVVGRNKKESLNYIKERLWGKL